MESGKIYVAEHDHVHAIKLVGDVRVTLCGEFYEYVQSLIADEGMVDCFIDLSEAENLDSTTLGVLAKIASNASKTRRDKPIICASDDSIYDLLMSMSFDKVFNVCRNLESKLDTLKELKQHACGDDELRCRVIEAHRVLMALSDENKATFSPLVDALEAERAAS